MIVYGKCRPGIRQICLVADEYEQIALPLVQEHILVFLFGNHLSVHQRASVTDALLGGDAAQALGQHAEPKKKPIDKLKREPSHSYGSVGGVRYEFAFLEEYDVDPYFRKVKARIDLVLPDAASDKELTVVFKTKDGGELQRLDRIALTTPDKYCFEVTMSENELVAGKAAVVAELLVEQVSRVGLLKKPVYTELAVAKVELSRELDV